MNGGNFNRFQDLVKQALTKMTKELYFKTTKGVFFLNILSPLNVYQKYKRETLDQVECD